MAIKLCVLLVFPVALLLLAGSSPAAAQLEVGYYSKTCPNVEAIVREEMEKITSAAPSLAGPLLRLHFHDCFVRVSYILTCTIACPVYILEVCTVPLVHHHRNSELTETLCLQLKIAGL